MQVGLDVTQAAKESGRGIARYIRELTPWLSEPELGLQLKPCIRAEHWLQRSLVQDLTPSQPPSWLPFSFWMSASNLDLFHSFGNHLPAFSSVPLSFTIHDFRVLDLQPGNGAGSRLMRNIRRASGVVCVTEHGYGRLLHYFPDMDPDFIAIVSHGVDHEKFHPQDPERARQAARQLGIESPFVLQLGSWFPHKNLELAIRAFALSRTRQEGFQLIFVGGGASSGHFRELLSLAQREGVEQQVHWIDDIGDQNLPAVLSAATALLQPSRYEGFSLPILEAMACGLPGVVSDSTCLPEVSAGIWPVCSQSDAEDFASGMDAICLDRERQQAAISAGLEHAAQFTWKKSAQKTAAFFHRFAQRNQDSRAHRGAGQRGLNA